MLTLLNVDSWLVNLSTVRRRQAAALDRSYAALGFTRTRVVDLRQQEPVGRRANAPLTALAGDCGLRIGVGASTGRLAWWRWRRLVLRLGPA
jgi:hypothetical protein